MVEVITVFSSAYRILVLALSTSKSLSQPSVTHFGHKLNYELGPAAAYPHHSCLVEAIDILVQDNPVIERTTV